MKLLLPLLLLSILIGCQVHNSSSNDEADYGQAELEPTPGDGDAKTLTNDRFNKALTILQKECSGCHKFFAKFTNESAFLENEKEFRVIAKDPAGSPLFRRIRGANVGGREDMPKRSSLSSEEVETIRVWIEGI